MMTGIPYYEEINDIHSETGSSLRTKNPLVHCFNMDDANDLEIDSMPPHRAGFYTLALNYGTENLDYTLKGLDFHHPEHFLLFVAPGQVVQWKKQGDWKGYTLFFKGELLQDRSQMNFLQDFPFFSLREINLIPISKQQFQSLRNFFGQIIAEQEAGDDFSEPVIRANLQVILWMARRVYEQSRDQKKSTKAADVIAAQFQYLVNEHFLKKYSVNEYAELLSVSPNHLTQTIQKATGQSAKSIISARRESEAKYLLKYTRNDIAEIAYHLGFSEPTHFSTFFKKATGQTPSRYRSES